MKNVKILKYIGLLGLMAILPLSQASAQSNTLATKPSDKAVISSEKSEDVKSPIEQNDLKDLSLSARKEKVEIEFKSIISQLSFFNSRTQGAIDRLTIKGVDTGIAQNELDLAKKSIQESKVNLEAFSKVVIVDGKQDKASSELKITSKKTEDSLREAKDRLINSLSIIKISLAS